MALAARFWREISFCVGLEKSGSRPGRPLERRAHEETGLIKDSVVSAHVGKFTKG